ncbi:hypothetical protein NP118_23630, partial [Salmonella enterica]|nr:hypothetical protein [Salmonella enterica]
YGGNISYMTSIKQINNNYNINNANYKTGISNTTKKMNLNTKCVELVLTEDGPQAHMSNLSEIVHDEYDIDCLAHLNENKFDLLVIETCIVENDDTTWILDSGATHHVCSSFEGMSS